MQVQRCSFSTAHGQYIQDVAIKTAVGDDDADLRAAEDSITGEARAICRVRSRCKCREGCPHVPRLLAVVPSPDDPASNRARALLFPPYPNCLYEALRAAKAAHAAAGGAGPVLPLHGRLILLRHIVRALACAERARIAHCDVKPSNIMVDAHGSAVLIDWGLATPHGEYCQGAFGTSAYVPPEMLDPGGFVAHSSLDVWSIGVVCLEMILPRRLTEGLHRDEVYALIQAGQLYADEVAQLAAAPEALSCERAWATVILRCLQPNPKRRATLRQLESFTTEQLAELESAPFPHECEAPCPSRALPPPPPCEAGPRRPAPSPVEARGGDCATEESSLDSSIFGGCAASAQPEAQSTAVEIAAATAAVLRLASVNSSAAFDLLRTTSGSAVSQDDTACTPAISAGAPHGQGREPAEAALPPRRPWPEARAPGGAPGPLLGTRAASTPAPLDGAQPLMSSCELESFDRFTDRARPVPTTTSPLALEDSALDTSPRVAESPARHPSATSPPPTCPRKRPQAWCHSQTRSRLSLSQLAAGAAERVSTPPSGPATCSRAVTSSEDPQLPFGRSPPDACLPFAADPVITAPVSPPSAHSSAVSSPSAAESNWILHVDLPRVRTVCDDGGGDGALPEIDDLLPASTAAGGGGSAPGSADSQPNGCHMSFGKFGAYTPASACAATAAATSALRPPPPPGCLAGVCEEPVAAAPTAEGAEPGQHGLCRSVFSAAADSLLLEVDDVELSQGSGASRHAARHPPGESPWLQTLHVQPERAVVAEQGCQEEQARNTACGGEGEADGSRRRRTWTWGHVSLNAAHCSVQSDLPDAPVPAGRAADYGTRCSVADLPARRRHVADVETVFGRRA